MSKRNQLDGILERHGIKDAESFILHKGKAVSNLSAVRAGIFVRSNIQLMMGRIVDRSDIERRLYDR